MTWYAEEPDFGPWAPRPVASVMADLLTRARPTRAAARTGPLVVAVVGRSAGGMFTVADRLAAAVAGAVVVHTDDVAWHQGYFDWDELLVDGILGPASPWRGRGLPASRLGRARSRGCDRRVGGRSRPPRRGRRILARRPHPVARRGRVGPVGRGRGVPTRIERDVRLGRTRDEAVAFWDEWMIQEVPFLAADRPWERADLVVWGTPHEGIAGLLVSPARAGPEPPAPRRS